MKLTAQSQVVFRVSNRDVKGQVNFKPDEWRVFSLVDGKRTVADIAQEIGIDVGIIWRIAESLYHAGKLELDPGAIIPQEMVEDRFFVQLTRQLTLILGAPATIIVEDETTAMDQTRGTFPKARAAELVERVSLSIRDDRKRLQFQQAMLEELRKI